MVDTRKIHSKKQMSEDKVRFKFVRRLAYHLSFKKYTEPSLKKASEWCKKARQIPMAHQTIDGEKIIRLDDMLSWELSEAMNFFNADAGTIYVSEKDTTGEILRFAYTKNRTKEKEGKFDYYSNMTLPVNSKSISGYVAETNVVLAIPDVYKLKGTPYGFNKDFDKSRDYKTESMLVAPLFGYLSNFEGVLQIINKMANGVPVPFSKRDMQCIEIIAMQIGGALDKALSAMSSLMSKANIVKLYDPDETGAHVQRVTDIALLLALEMGIPLGTDPKLRPIFEYGARMHDIGKIATSLEILKKAGKLTKEEYDIMKEHTEQGFSFFEKSAPPFDIPAQIALSHHEKWDGTGYPQGKSGDEIPIAGRIVALADVCDAMVSKRCYKQAKSFEEVFNEIVGQKGKHFDPHVVEAFVRAKDKIRQIMARNSE